MTDGGTEGGREGGREGEQREILLLTSSLSLLRLRTGEGEVARGDQESSVYYVKNALDANITYTAPPHTGGGGSHREKEEEEEEEGEGGEGEGGEGEGGGSVHMPDIGEGTCIYITYMYMYCKEPH